MMTLDESIKRFEKLASDYDFNLDMHQRNVMKLSVNDIERMKRNAQENRQLAGWLRELKRWRDFGNNIGRVLGRHFSEEELFKMMEVNADEWR